MVNTYSGGTATNVGNSAIYVVIDGVDSGLALPGADFEAAIETSPTQFLQDTAPREEKVSAQTVTFTMTLAELTNANLKNYLAGLATISGSDLKYGDSKGESLPTYEVKLYPEHPATHPLSGRVITIHKATIKPNGPITFDPSNEDFEGLPVIITAVKDTSQSAGEEYFTIAAAVTTAPTISSSSPTDGGTGVAVDDDIILTMNVGIGEGTATAENIIIAKSDLSAFVTPTIVVGNLIAGTGDKKKITITHDDLAAGTEYAVILGTGICSTYGVPMTTPDKITFTTAA